MEFIEIDAQQITQLSAAPYVAEQVVEANGRLADNKALTDYLVKLVPAGYRVRYQINIIPVLVEVI